MPRLQKIIGTNSKFQFFIRYAGDMALD